MPCNNIIHEQKRYLFIICLGYTLVLAPKRSESGWVNDDILGLKLIDCYFFRLNQTAGKLITSFCFFKLVYHHVLFINISTVEYETVKCPLTYFAHIKLWKLFVPSFMGFKNTKTFVCNTTYLVIMDFVVQNKIFLAKRNKQLTFYHWLLSL